MGYALFLVRSVFKVFCGAFFPKKRLAEGTDKSKFESNNEKHFSTPRFDKIRTKEVVQSNKRQAKNERKKKCVQEETESPGLTVNLTVIR